MRIRWDPRRQRAPRIQGGVVVDSFRGTLRVRKWPRKRGPSKSEAVRRQNEWFKGAIDLAKRVDPRQQALAIAMTKGTGLYPRDLLVKSMAGGIIDIIEADGSNPQPGRRFRETKVFQGCILQLTSNITFTANIALFPSWPTPVKDTLGFWDISAPTEIKIPAGVNVVELVGQIAVSPDPGSFDLHIARISDGLVVAADNSDTWLQMGMSCQTGPMVVTAGDRFRLRGVTAVTRSTTLSRRNYFSCNVLDAD